MWTPSASTQGAAINQWPVTTTRIETALRKSTQRFRFAGVFSAKRAAALQRDSMPTGRIALLRQRWILLPRPASSFDSAQWSQPVCYAHPVPAKRFFASDNAAGVHPAILEAIHEANAGHALAYGHDHWTDSATVRIQESLGADARILFVFGGTGANVVGLSTAVDSYHAVLCAESSHLWRDECAAPERFLGCKIVPIATDDGKLRPEDVSAHLNGVGDVHHAQPRVISVSQSTEWGTVYTPDELRALADLAHQSGMLLHVDGARVANAAAALDVPLGALGAEARVDVMTLGGTKLGMLLGEAVAVFDAGLKERAAYYQKQGMQLVSKMRFVAAQFSALLTDNLWLELAAHANDMARQLGEELDAVEGVSLVEPVHTNMVYARFPDRLAGRVQQEVGPFHCPTSDPAVGRLVTAWDTQRSDVTAFVDGVARIIDEQRAL